MTSVQVYLLNILIIYGKDPNFKSKIVCTEV